MMEGGNAGSDTWQLILSQYRTERSNGYHGGECYRTWYCGRLYRRRCQLHGDIGGEYGRGL
jgi:hypothetical protein